MRDVAVVGVGMTSFGELWETPLRSLWAEAALAAPLGLGCRSMILLSDQKPIGQRVLASSRGWLEQVH